MTVPSVPGQPSGAREHRPGHHQRDLRRSCDASGGAHHAEAPTSSAAQDQRGKHRRCRLHQWTRRSLGRTRLLGAFAPPCLTSPPQLALLLVLLPALLHPIELSVSRALYGAGDAGGLGKGSGAGGGGGGGAWTQAWRAPPSPLAGAAAQDAGAGAGAGAGEGAGSQCGPRYTGMVELAAATCSRHEYTPGNYTMFLDSRHRQLGQSGLGDRGRLLAALQRYREGGNLTVGVVGGSIAAGQGAHDAPAFPYWLKQILESQLPGGSGRVRLNNGAMPGTSSAYMSTCHNVHVPPDVDIVILEYALNDEEMPMPHMNNGVRRPFERLVRKLLQYPRRPAVVLMHSFRWFQDPVSSTGQFWSSSERQHGEFGVYYGLQQLSVKACCYHLMREDREGFSVKRPRADHTGRPQPADLDAQLRGRVFYFDVLHPDGHTGHRVMGELAAQLVLDAWAQVSSGYSLSAEDAAAVAAPLPPPMLEANTESRSDHCFIGPALQQTVIHRQSFEWVNEGKNPLLPKWGYVATIPGADMKFRVNTKSTGTRTQEVNVELGYLRSYENMGRANVSCEGGCTCATWTLDGHHDQRNSQTFLQGFAVSQAEECIIAVRVLETSSTGKHKVKISGIMVSEDPENRPFDNKAAWDWIVAGSSKSTQGVFDLKSVVRRSLLATHRAASAALQQRYLQQQQHAVQHAVDNGRGEAMNGAAGGGAV